MITNAENEVNKYLSKRYSIAALQAAVPPLVTSLTETLTEGYMYQRMSRGGKEGLAHGKALIEPVINNLLMISTYKADLVNSVGATIADSASNSFELLSSTNTYSNTFDEDSELLWEVDQDKLDDIESGREWVK